MKRVTWIGLAVLGLVGIHSSVYPCDHTAKASTVASSGHGKTLRTFVVSKTPGCSLTEVSVPVVSFDIDVPGRTRPRFVHIVARETPEAPHSRVQTALALGRAFVTAVEAVMGSLIDAAMDKTASLV